MNHAWDTVDTAILYQTILIGIGLILLKMSLATSHVLVAPSLRCQPKARAHESVHFVQRKNRSVVMLFSNYLYDLITRSLECLAGGIRSSQPASGRKADWPTCAGSSGYCAAR